MIFTSAAVIIIGWSIYSGGIVGLFHGVTGLASHTISAQFLEDGSFTFSSTAVYVNAIVHDQ